MVYPLLWISLIHYHFLTQDIAIALSLWLQWAQTLYLIYKDLTLPGLLLLTQLFSAFLKENLPAFFLKSRLQKVQSNPEKSIFKWTTAMSSANFQRNLGKQHS